jgi:hypothetical protein
MLALKSNGDEAVRWFKRGADLFQEANLPHLELHARQQLRAAQGDPKGGG